MKKLFTLAVIVLLSIQTYSQVGYGLNGLNLIPNTALSSCDTVVTVSFWAQSAANNAGQNYDLPYVISGTNFVPSQFSFQILWGDGTSNSYNGGISTQGTVIPLNPSPTHTYPSPGTYSIVTYILNMANQTAVVDTVSYTVGSCSLPVYSMFQVDCDNNGTIDSTLNNVSIPLILTGSGQVYTGSTQNNFYNFTGIQPGLYTVTIDPAWLSANNYVIGNVQGPQSIVTGNGAATMIYTLNCGNGGGGNPISMCVTGTVFCDQDSNGVYSAGDIYMVNAPIQVNYGNGNAIVYTNASGNYSASYMGLPNTTAIVSLNANWMVQHGYSAVFSVDTILNTPCQGGLPPANASFPILCGPNPGSPNCFSGYVFCDANNNGTMQAGESPLAFVPIVLTGAPGVNNLNSVTVYTDSTGHFTYCGQISNTNYAVATISQQYLANNGYTTNTQTVNLVGNQNGVNYNGMFAINCGGNGAVCTDLWTTVTPWIGYYQNTVAHVRLNWGNYGPLAPGTYTLTFNFPVGVTVNTATINTPGYVINGNTITWNLNSAAASFSNNDIITFNVPGGIVNGAQHYFTSNIAATGNFQDCNAQNNNGSLLQIVGNSYDPNDKNVDRGIAYQSGMMALATDIDVDLTDALTYTVRFQNTGTAPAQNIFILDTMDSNLDLSTFEVVQTSHPMVVVDLGNGIKRFEFNGIWLADSASNEPASHGYLIYKISENVGNAIGSEITNTAHIYFDWNPAIVTNTTYNVNILVWGIDENETEMGRVYPNPTQSNLNIDLNGGFAFSLYDLQGRTLDSQNATDQATIDLKGLNSGSYLLVLTQGSKSKTFKITKL
ncbi:MAG: T9SS type A sorting domain-containing protein [Flavobacteriia bacterium]